MVSDPIYLSRRVALTGAVAWVLLGGARAATPPAAPSESAGAAPTASGAQAALQRLFAQIAALGERRAAFVERRISVLFRNPPEARGTLYFKPPALLVRETITPRREHVRIEGERVTLRVEGTGDEAGKTIERSARLDALPQLAALAGTLRALLAGDLATLQRSFDVELTQAPAAPPSRWTLKLTPIDAELATAVQQAVIDGRGNLMERLVFVEATGDRTELTVTPLPATSK